MGRILVGLLVAIGAAGVLGAQEQGQTVFRGGSEIVRAFVTVTDRDGRLVTTLRKEDFELRDEGKPQPITIFDNSPRALRLIVMLDVSGSMRGNLPVLRNGTTQLVKYLRLDDRARIGTFGREVVISPTFTRDPRELLAALPAEIDEQAPTPLWRAIDTAMESFPPAEGDARDVIVVLSDGADSGPMMGGRFVSQAEVIDRARRRDVMIYGIGMRSRGRPSGGFGPGGLQAALMADMPDPSLAKVAEETGGGYAEINVGDNLGLAFGQVAEELRSQYLLGFDPPKRDGKVHDIQIRIGQSGMKPRARKNYTAPKG